uniref:Gustatory receptor n=1 Tax=Timema shepardi TaxID=629360 RepID=A0A7R9G0F4_TIMSH|nr:unnamed protein product [Timema shepardi]
MGDHIFLQSVSLGVMGSLPVFTRTLYPSASLFYCYRPSTGEVVQHNQEAQRCMWVEVTVFLDMLPDVYVRCYVIRLWDYMQSINVGKSFLMKVAVCVLNVSQQDGFLLRYRVMSADFFWGIILHTTLNVFNIMLEYDKWIILMMPYSVTRSALIISLCHYYDRFQPDLVRLIGDFDRSCKEMRIAITTYKCNRGIIWSAIIVLVVISMLLTVVIKRISMHDSDCQQLISSLILGVVGVIPVFTRMFYISAFLFYCYSLKTRFEILNSHCKILVSQLLTTDVRCGYPVSDDVRLEKVRTMHGQLCSIIEKLNDAYGWRLLLFFMTIFLDFLHDVYVYGYIKQLWGSMQIIFFVINMVALYVSTAVPAGLEESTLLLQRDMREASLSRIDSRSQFQAKLIMLARPVHISAAGFCKVNKTLLLTIILTLATYLVMLGQFNPTIQKLINERSKTNNTN